MALPALRGNPMTPGMMPLAQAAALMGLDEGHLRRVCAEQYAPAGLAEKRDGEWWIARRVDPKLSGLETRDARDLRQIAEAETAGTSKRHIAVARARREVVLGFDARTYLARTDEKQIDEYLVTLRTEGSLPSVEIPVLSRRTLRRWRADYGANGIAGLIPQFAARGNVRHKIGESAWAFFLGEYQGGTGQSLRKSYIITLGAARLHGMDAAWEWPGFGTVRRRVRAEIAVLARVMANKGPRTARAQCVPHGRRDFESIASGEEWCGDEHKFDTTIRVLTDRGWRATRNVLMTAWQDWRSRMIVGYVIRTYADSGTILGATKIGIRQFGKPRLVRVDWGNDYKRATGCPHLRRFKSFDGPRIAGIFEAMGIAVHPVTPYLPQAKLIESLFGKVKDSLDRLFPSFQGGSPVERREDHHHWVRENLEKLPTLAEFSAVVADCIDVYHRTPHGAADLFGKTPLQAMEAFRAEPPRMETDAVLDHLFRSYTEPRLVRRDGVRWRGRWYGWGDARLVALQGRKVLLGIQPDDAGRAMVCEVNDDRTPLFEVECAPLRGFTQRDAADLAKQKAAILRPYREQTRAARKTFLQSSPRDRLAAYAAGQRALHGDGEPRSEPAAPLLRVRPALEEAIQRVDETAIKAASIAARTGTDDADEINLADVLQPAAWSASPVDELDDTGPSLSELSGEDYGD